MSVTFPPPSLEKLVEICVQRDLSLGFAESCTGGLLSSALTVHPGVSKIFKGSIVSYSGESKADLLNIPYSLMHTHGQVSLPVAQAMARGAKLVFKCTWAASITGIAGPSGGSVDKPVGTVCFGFVGPGFEQSVIQQFDSGLPRVEIQRQAVIFALDFLLDAIK